MGAAARLPSRLGPGGARGPHRAAGIHQLLLARNRQLALAAAALLLLGLCLLLQAGGPSDQSQAGVDVQQQQQQPWGGRRSAIEGVAVAAVAAGNEQAATEQAGVEQQLATEQAGVQQQLATEQAAAQQQAVSEQAALQQQLSAESAEAVAAATAAVSASSEVHGFVTKQVTRGGMGRPCHGSIGHNHSMRPSAYMLHRFGLHCCRGRQTFGTGTHRSSRSGRRGCRRGCRSGSVPSLKVHTRLLGLVGCSLPRFIRCTCLPLCFPSQPADRLHLVTHTLLSSRPLMHTHMQASRRHRCRSTRGARSL